MGCSYSKQDGNAALRLCKERMQYIQQAIDSRYALSAAQLSYVQSLRNVGSALRQFAEAETLIESSLSTSEPDKSPSHSSYASPSPSPIANHVSSPCNGGSPYTPLSSINYMRTTGTASVKVTVNSTQNNYCEEGSSPSFLFPPPPPDIDSSWDFFDPIDRSDNSGVQNGEPGRNINFCRLRGSGHLNEKEVSPPIEEERGSLRKNEEKKWDTGDVKGVAQSSGYSQLRSNGGGGTKVAVLHSANGNVLERSTDLVEKKVAQVGGIKPAFISANGKGEALGNVASSNLSRSKRENEMKESSNAREDASDFITHRAKDLFTSMKEIEHRFTRAAESGHELSRMLETNKIRLNISSQTIGKSSNFQFLSAFLTCCKAENTATHELDQPVAKVITWNRSVSSQSSSSRNPLILTSKDDISESCSDFVEDFCMISGSHSSTLDRLYAWERKLHDELKASESIWKAYDRKCIQLRHQFARDLDVHVIDKTRAVVKDLHSRLSIAIQAVGSISKRIEKLRDEELQPQLIELIQGLIRMWKVMLETHHAQYITISLAYHVKSSSVGPPSETYRQALLNLRSEIDCFSSSFSNWVDAHKSYVEALNSWLQKCVLQPQERSRGRKVTFSPRRARAPPIFVVLRDWSTGITSLPSVEVNDSIKCISSDLHGLFKQQEQEKETKRKTSNIEETDLKQENKEVDKCEIESKLCNLQASLTRMFEWLIKFAETILKIYDDVKQENEKARAAYTCDGMR
ncbi:uncharacterized protein [Typha angustifolia]|uniref:uncharacterized protein n=1 Tax=Typha angustifolia TaxID=59011 RepID=UPI003C2AAF88